MYHELTYQELRARRRRRIAIAVVTVVLALVAWLAVGLSQALQREQAAASVRESVVRSALMCCAVEGSYPTSVEHLEEHYGLVYNEAEYRVNYEWLGDNIPPSVVVTPR